MEILVQDQNFFPLVEIFERVHRYELAKVLGEGFWGKEDEADMQTGETMNEIPSPQSLVLKT
jgi:hypothetical protein